MTNSDRIAIRRRTVDDEQAVQRLFQDSRDYMLALLPVAMRPSILDMQYRAFQASLVSRVGLRDELAVLEGIPIARILTCEHDDPFVCLDITVISSLRGNGIGSRLLERFFDRADVAGASIELRVRLGNPAERLYTRLGFVRTATDDIDATMQRVSVGRRTIG